MHAPLRVSVWNDTPCCAHDNERQHSESPSGAAGAPRWLPLEASAAPIGRFARQGGNLDWLRAHGTSDSVNLTGGNLIEHFDLQQIVGSDNDAFVMYVLHIKNGKTLENVEHLQMRGGKVQAVRCYFGGKGYPAAVVNQK